MKTFRFQGYVTLSITSVCFIDSIVKNFFLCVLLLFLFEKKEGSLKEQISTVKPVLEDLLMKKDLRWKELSETLSQITEISSNIAGNDYPVSSGPDVDDSDLTQRKLDELRAHLQDLRNEKVFLHLYTHVKY